MAVRQRPVRGLDAVEALLVFAELEMQIAGFYERLAEMFDDDQQVSEFWLQLSGEEIEHADALRCAAETLPLRPPGDWGRRPLIECGIINKLVRELKACEALMTLHDRSLDVAFQCALFLESSELNQIYQWLLDKVPVMWTETLRVMNEDPGQHILHLCQAIERYGQDRRLRQQARALRNQWEEFAMK